MNEPKRKKPSGSSRAHAKAISEMTAPVRSRMFKESLQKYFAACDDPDPQQDWMNVTVAEQAIPSDVLEEAIRKNSGALQEDNYFLPDYVTLDSDSWDEFTLNRLLSGYWSVSVGI